MSLLLILTCYLHSVGQARNVKLDNTNSSQIRIEFFGFEQNDTVIIKINGAILFDTAFTTELLKTYMPLRLRQGDYVISISSKEKPIIAMSTFTVDNEIHFEEDTTYKFCNMIELGYIPKYLKVENYRKKTIDKEYETKITEWHLNDKFQQQQYRKILEDRFINDHGKDLDFVGRDEYYLIDIKKCKKSRS